MNISYHKFRLQRGFTIVEISIVLVIVGLILGGVLNARSVIRKGQTKDIIKAVNELSTAAQQFKDRYGMWPGDFNNATASIAGMACANGDGNLQIQTLAETSCASEMLIRSGMLRGTAGNPIMVRGSTTLSVTASTAALTGIAAGRLPGNAANAGTVVVRVQNIDCDIALQIDRATDDGNVDTGNFRTGNVCAGQDESIAVTNAVLKIN
jgi:prepilin-type N-terminal cleavage/methylation domain-containing protein